MARKGTAATWTTPQRGMLVGIHRVHNGSTRVYVAWRHAEPGDESMSESIIMERRWGKELRTVRDAVKILVWVARALYDKAEPPR